MPKWADRSKQGLEDWFTKKPAPEELSWGDRIKGWLAGLLSWAFEIFFGVLEKAAAPKLTPLIEKLERETTIPPELKPLFDELKEPGSAIGALLANSAGGALLGGALGRIIDYILRPLTYGLSFSPGFYIHDAPVLIGLWRRGVIDEKYLDDHLRWHGLGSDDIEQLKKVTEIRLDAASVVTAWRRDPTKYEGLFDDLRHQGWDSKRIEALKFFTLYYPSPAELVHWTAREVFEPDMVAKYRLAEGKEKLRREDFYKAGMDDEQIDNHWIAHWEHASWMQIIEMLHRHIISEQDVKDWFPLVEMAPFWADNLIKIAYSWPTRVDVRRFWDMRTIDEARLKELYEGMGYHDKNLEDYIKWTKVYTDFPMMLTRFRNGWITEEDIRGWLAGLEIPGDRIDQFIEEKTKPEKPAQVESERQATATEIMKAVKMEIITRDEGVEMLGDLGYDKDTAEFKLTVYLGVAAGSPETYIDFKDITQKWRKAADMPAKIPPEELKRAAAELLKLTKDVEALKRAIEEEERKLIDVEILPAEATARRDELRLALHRAEAELHRVQTDYDSLVAEWRHKEV